MAAPVPSEGSIVLKNNDIKGNDISSCLRSSWADCFGPCYYAPGCNSFSWNSYNGGTCWLKSTTDRGSLYSNSGVYSGFICGLSQNKDISGNDIGTQQAQDPKQCCSYCAQISGCKAFSWSEWNGGTCFLKSGGNLIDNAGVVAWSG